MEKEILDQDLKDMQARARQRKWPGRRPKAEVCLLCLRTAGDLCGYNRVTEGTDAAEGLLLPLSRDRWEAIGGF